MSKAAALLNYIYEAGYKDWSPEQKAKYNSPEEVAKRKEQRAAKMKEVGDTPLELLQVYIGKGNKKLDKKIKTFNLPAIKSCPNAGECAKKCYAVKSEKRYADVAASRARNFRLAKESTELLKKKIEAKLRPGDIVRIHESGDMFNQAYLDMWNSIVADNPDIMFYTYTKTEDILDWSSIKKHKNFNLVSSMINGEKNFGPLEQMEIKAKELNLPLCPCKPGNNVRCGVDCSICMTKSKKGEGGVLFVEH